MVVYRLSHNSQLLIATFLPRTGGLLRRLNIRFTVGTDYAQSTRIRLIGNHIIFYTNKPWMNEQIHWFLVDGRPICVKKKCGFKNTDIRIRMNVAFVFAIDRRITRHT